jgi:hypothetical protein
MVPVAFAVKGSEHAARLWQYKSDHAERDVAARAAACLLALLLGFLRDHSTCVWRAAGGPGPAWPTHLAVVPSARGRAGAHPLHALVAPFLTGPWAEMIARPDSQRTRDLDPERFRAAPIPGASVLLLDDTWTTGASVQSAAMALRRAGAHSVAAVVLGRHVAAADLGRAAMPFSAELCAAHGSAMSLADRRLDR